MACRTAVVTSPAIPEIPAIPAADSNASRCWTANWRWRAAGKRSAAAQRGSARLLRSSSVGAGRVSMPACTAGWPTSGAARRRAVIDSEDWPRSSARFYLSLPQSDWAQWLPAGLTQEWKIARAKAGGDFWFDWRRHAQRRHGCWRRS